MAKAAQALHANGYYANYLDLTVESTGVLCGLGNTIATSAGVATPLFAAWSFDYAGESWIPIVLALVVIDLIAVAAISFGMSVECLDEEPNVELSPRQARDLKIQ